MLRLRIIGVKFMIMFKAVLLVCLAIILSGCEAAKNMTYNGKVSGKEFIDAYCRPQSAPSTNKPQKYEIFKLDSHSMPDITGCKK
jgi:hypothetical protein